MTFQLNEADVARLQAILSDLIDARKPDEAAVIAGLLNDPKCTDPNRWILLGLQAIQVDDLDTAESNLKKAVKLGAANPHLYLEMSKVLFMKAMDSQAITWAQKAIESAPEFTDAHFFLAQIHASKGKIDDALAVLQKVLDSKCFDDEVKCEAHKNLGVLLMNARRYEEAIPHLQKALHVEDDESGVYINLGHCYSRGGDLENALVAFKNAVKLDLNAKTLYLLGDCLLGLERNEEAIAVLERAARLNPNHVMVNYDLSLAYYNEWKHKEGASAARRALAADPRMEYQRSNPGLGATLNLGLCLMEQSKFKEALACFDKNIGLAAPSFFNRGLTLYKMNRALEAIDYFKIALEINPKDVAALNLLGQALDDIGSHKDAVASLQKALKIDPKYGLGYYDLGVILAKKKDKRAEAMRCFKKALTLLLDDHWKAQALYSIACLHAVAGRGKDALAALEQALKDGYSDRAHIEKDKDFDRLRRDPKFKELIEKYLKK